MNLKPETEKALDAWLAPNTWPSTNLTDMNRWYRFVDQYQRDHGYTIHDEAQLQETIRHRAGPGSNETLCEVIGQRVSLMGSILEFLKETGR